MTSSSKTRDDKKPREINKYENVRLNWMILGSTLHGFSKRSIWEKVPGLVSVELLGSDVVLSSESRRSALGKSAFFALFTFFFLDPKIKYAAIAPTTNVTATTIQLISISSLIIYLFKWVWSQSLSKVSEECPFCGIVYFVCVGRCGYQCSGRGDVCDMCVFVVVVLLLLCICVLRIVVRSSEEKESYPFIHHYHLSPHHTPPHHHHQQQQ